MSTKIAFIILKKQRMLKILKNLKLKQIEMIYAWRYFNQASILTKTKKIKLASSYIKVANSVT